MTDRALELLPRRPDLAELAAFPFDFDVGKGIPRVDEVYLASGATPEPTGERLREPSRAPERLGDHVQAPRAQAGPLSRRRGRGRDGAVPRWHRQGLGRLITEQHPEPVLAAAESGDAELAAYDAGPRQAPAGQDRQGVGEGAQPAVHPGEVGGGGPAPAVLSLTTPAAGRPLIPREHRPALHDHAK